jgi:hypothetical protein
MGFLIHFGILSVMCCILFKPILQTRQIFAALHPDGFASAHTAVGGASACLHPLLSFSD